MRELKFKNSASNSKTSRAFVWPMLGVALGAASFVWWASSSDQWQSWLQKKESSPQTIAAFSKQVPVQLPAPHCDVLLNFFGRLDDLPSSQSWLETTQNLYTHEDAEVRFCGRLITAVWAEECADRDGRATCQLLDPDTYDQVWMQPAWPAAQQVDVVLTDSGLANTRNGLVFIDRQARGRVLAHELGHTLGLADEYPMSRDLAERFCAGEFDFSALNMIITDRQELTTAELVSLTQTLPWVQHLQQPIAQKRAENVWQLGSTDPLRVGLHPVATCEDTGFYAWRPVGYVTLMQQHEVGQMPNVYLRLMQTRLNKKASDTTGLYSD